MKCYIPGQCQEYSVDFVASHHPDHCAEHCRKHNAKLEDDDVHKCNWWSWEPGQDLCLMFHNCTVGTDGLPTGAVCPLCLSGQGE